MKFYSKINESSCRAACPCDKRGYLRDIVRKPSYFHFHFSLPSKISFETKFKFSRHIISKRDIARIKKILFKIEMQEALHSLLLYQKGTFPSHFFSENFWSNCHYEQISGKGFERPTKFLYQRLRKHLNIRYLNVLYRANVPRKKSKMLWGNANVGFLLQ